MFWAPRPLQSVPARSESAPERSGAIYPDPNPVLRPVSGPRARTVRSGSKCGIKRWCPGLRKPVNLHATERAEKGGPVFAA
eukprot:6339837-Pyramimonas_sp.AAC.1